MIENMRSLGGQRYTDLALDMIDIIDRKLYECSCEVRWWATDSDVVECHSDGRAEARDHACSRLGVILDSYTAYRDLWVVDANDVVVANGRHSTCAVRGRNVAGAQRYKAAMKTTSAAHYVASEVETLPATRLLVRSLLSQLRARRCPNGKIHSG